MKRKRFSEEQIIAILREHEAGVATADLCRKHGMSSASFYAWKAKYGGMDVADVTQPLQTRPTLKLGWTRDLEGKHAPEALHAGGDRCEITAS